MASKRDYYEVLGLQKTATKDEIKKAFKKMAKKYHPDINKEAHAEEKYKEALEAYEVLGDDQRRAQYDQYGHDAFAGGMGGFSQSDFDFGDIFSEMFGGFGSFFGGGTHSRSATAPRKGSDIRLQIVIDFEEAAFGVTKKIQVTRMETCAKCHGVGAENPNDVETCPKCGGSGRIRVPQNTPFGTIQTEQVCPECHGIGKILKNKCSECYGAGIIEVSRTIDVQIPAGIDDGQTIRLSGQGNAGSNQGPDGDLFISVRVREHEFFKRSGNDIYCTVPITFTQAALGGDITVPTLTGKVVLHLPEGTQTDAEFRLKDRGITSLHSGIKGSQYVKVRVLIPKKLTKKQKEILEALQKDLPMEDYKSNFFEKVKRFFR